MVEPGEEYKEYKTTYGFKFKVNRGKKMGKPLNVTLGKIGEMEGEFIVAKGVSIKAFIKDTGYILDEGKENVYVRSTGGLANLNSLVIDNETYLIAPKIVAEKRRDRELKCETKEKGNKCSAKIEFGDDFGDNETTFHCELKRGHKGKHRETGDMSYEEGYTQPYTLEWEDRHKEVQK